jgi:copper homeostasis protein (lipoprotein)
MKKLLIVLLLCPLGFSCDPPEDETTSTDVPEWTDESVGDNDPLVIDQPEAEPNEVILEADASEWIVYEGTISCADCEGIKMRLKLENRSGADDKTYELTETYLGTKDGNRSFQSRGIYQITYGHENDPSAILITLVDKNKEQRVLIQEDSENLTLLNQEGKKISSQLNYTLIKL